MEKSTSARITPPRLLSQGLQEFPGRIEARLNVPAGKGMVAFWMLGTGFEHFRRSGKALAECRRDRHHGIHRSRT